MIQDRYVADGPYPYNRILAQFNGYDNMRTTLYCCNNFKGCGLRLSYKQFHEHLQAKPSHALCDEKGILRSKEWYSQQKGQHAKWDRYDVAKAAADRLDRQGNGKYRVLFPYAQPEGSRFTWSTTLEH